MLAYDRVLKDYLYARWFKSREFWKELKRKKKNPELFTQGSDNFAGYAKTKYG
jgi:NAD-dependent SIR2 family protein deacetylase